MIFAVFFSHGVDESHQNAKTASHNNANNLRTHFVTSRIACGFPSLVFVPVLGRFGLIVWMRATKTLKHSSQPQQRQQPANPPHYKVCKLLLL
jgi:nitrate reductase NapE component